jgi:hypothetical protein
MVGKPSMTAAVARDGGEDSDRIAKRDYERETWRTGLRNRYPRREVFRFC